MSCVATEATTPEIPRSLENETSPRTPPGESLFFLHSEALAEYLENQRATFDVFIQLVLLVFGFSFYFGRCNVLHPFDDGFFQSISFVSNSTALSLYITFLSLYYVKLNSQNEGSISYRTSCYILESPLLGNLFIALIGIFGTFGVAFGLYGRVRNGPCAVGVTLWDTQRCNPVANNNALPLDHTSFMYAMPLILQSVMNGMTYRGTFISWLITFITTILSLIEVGGRLEVWVLCSSLAILVVTYKYEKLARFRFAHKKNKQAADKAKRNHILLQESAEHNLLSEKIKHELEILAIKSQEECRLMEKEQEQMVAMIGNIAHDLKTPLQSFLMDLESLRAHQEYHHVGSEPHDIDGPASILQSLESTCCFMSMAINRSIDFAKASRNIALVPHMETFNMPEAMDHAVSVIRHLKSSAEIVVRPFPSTMCVNMITDKHWFKENILCLLSNAVKYSNGGIVTLTVSHVTSLSKSMADLQAEVESYATNSELSRLSNPNYESMVMISIEDGGIGISEKIREDLFQPFKQVQRLAGGTGLGLYSLSNRIRALKGTRGVKSRDDGKQGSVFWFAIPYRPDLHCSTESSTICTPNPRSRRSSIGGPTLCLYDENGVCAALCGDSTPTLKVPLRFLVVDDSSSIVKVLRRALLNKKYEVETANNGIEGLERMITGYDTNQFDVVLMDLQMPMMDGIEAVRRYREFEANKRVIDNLAAAAKDLESVESIQQSRKDSLTPFTPVTDLYAVSSSRTSLSAKSPCTTPPSHTSNVLSSTTLSPSIVPTNMLPVNMVPLSRSPSRDDPRVDIRGEDRSISRGISRSASKYASNRPSRGASRGASRGDPRCSSRCELFIIGMSANSDEDTKQCALNAGMNTFLAKPFALAELMPLLHQMDKN